MNNKSALLFIHAQTSLHPGSGTSTGAIDLPVQRERHTDWPLIPGSTVKGVLRDYCRLKEIENREISGDTEGDNKKSCFQKADEVAALECVFGPSQKSNRADEHAGALAVTDARILLFPVRSLCGLFAWVTCPAVLDRLRRDAKFLTDMPMLVPEIPLGNDKDAFVSLSDALLVKNPFEGSNMVLEEFDFKASKQEGNGLQTFAKTIAEKLDLKRLETHLAVISDDMFTYFVKNATEVNPKS
ncbi:MAG: type III-B CRISPR module RAMP protein Cmr4 [Candidatus Omnitrophica bacterium]|nr:type III-B CRISPR module RAMP protein Cmr4 [Candidatus Omnitrophota bacterium]MBU4479406.1 type III-B CRISPR module RAMP protein Cmr4 [Candidatus Omnitrophota bacterium]MCG2703947.1 type III-B CRISPR module RAMP protein Cmr4 [Candidatus Omnitrophota bacterium]